MKATMFQNILLEKYHECFPVRIMKISCDDKPWFSSELKDIDRRRKREFSKNYKSDLWRNLEEMFNEKCSIAKEKYHTTIVRDRKESNPGKWYSKLKRMSGQDTGKQQNILVEELAGYSDLEQADRIAKHYAEVSNQYDAIKKKIFQNTRIRISAHQLLNPGKFIKLFRV